MQAAALKLYAAPPEPMNRQDYRDAMSRLAAAVNVVTTDGPCGRAGFTATAVCSVSDDPPTLLVCLNRSASAHAAVVGNGNLCVNLLSAEQSDVSNLFGGKTPMAERFTADRWSISPNGSPVLAGAALAFDCRITQVTSVATHDVLFCEVLGVTLAEQANALLYFDRSYHPLPVSL
ncbi:flavin reductase [Stutzerimonas tarimensis]|uniref:FMN reductase (NADH) RutF n=1 Tax=Stutzerimonas tarimensis TaxID=1507735 RepID=A0ABV7T3Q6_9GAMM